MGRYDVPRGRIVKGWVVRLEPTPQQVSRFRRDDGARRFACNWAVGQIHEALSSGSEKGRYNPQSGRTMSCASVGIASSPRSRRGGQSVPKRRTPTGSQTR